MMGHDERRVCAAQRGPWRVMVSKVAAAAGRVWGPGRVRNTGESGWPCEGAGPGASHGRVRYRADTPPFGARQVGNGFLFISFRCCF